jgi:hypothetical protein
MTRSAVSTLLGGAAVFAFLLGAGYVAVDRRPADAEPVVDVDGRPHANETYRWRPVAIGGGGFITGIAMDATGGTMVARADVHGAYRWSAAADRWVPLVTVASMPPEARTQAGMNDGVYEIVAAPGDPRRLYMAVKGRVYRSDDAGDHWRVASPARVLTFDANGPFRLSGPFLAVSPKSPDIVLFGTPEDGLLRSADGGAHWSRVAGVPASASETGSRGPGKQGAVVWFDPANPHRAYAAPGGGGVLVSQDDGATFARMAGGPATVTQAAVAKDGSLFAVDEGAQRAWVSRKGAWTDLAKAGLASSPFAGVAVSASGRVAVVADRTGQFWCSGDGGTSWSHLLRSIAVGKGEPPWLAIPNAQGYFEVGRIGFDPKVPGRLWIATGVGPYRADIGDACPWTVKLVSQVRGIEELVAMDALSAPGQAPLFAALDFGIHRKSDLNRFSTSYGPKPRVLIAAQQLDASPAAPGFVVTNASDTRTCCSGDGDAVLAGTSRDGGATWSKFPTLPRPPGTGDGDPWRMAYGTIAVSADDPDNIVWEPAFNRSPFYTRDGGRSWQRVVLPGEKLPYTGAFEGIWGGRKTLVADRVQAHTFYLFHDGGWSNPQLKGLWRTTDGGAHWSRVFEGEIAPDVTVPARLRAVPREAGHLFFTAGLVGGRDVRLRRSSDGGASWTIVPGMEAVDDIGFGRSAEGRWGPTMFVSGRYRGEYGIWRSVDEGANWQRVGGFPLGSLDQVSVVAGDANVFGRVYVGYRGSGWAYGEPARCPAAPYHPGDAADCERIEDHPPAK